MGTEHEADGNRGRALRETRGCPGGALCLDFCNTGQGERDARGGEWLADYRELVDWLEASGALDIQQARRFARSAQGDPESAARAHRQALVVREALQRAIEARAHGKAPATEDLDCVAAEHRRAAAFSRLRWQGARAVWALDPEASAPAAMLQPILQSAVELLGSESIERVRRCGNPRCSWLFLDHTRNRSRRWCDMAACGNLHKVRRHRERQSAAVRRRGATKR